MSSSIRRVVSCLIVCFFIALPASANTFVVKDTGDASDDTPGDGICATAGNVCTLRAAIEEANATANSGGPDEILFDISGSTPHVIQPASALPTITEPVYLQGDDEPDYVDSPVVVLDGQNAGGSVSGLTVSGFSGSNVIIEGLSIVNFGGNGITLDNVTSVLVYNNYIGVAADESAAGNGGNGIEITGGASSITVGNGTATGNVISNNSSRGIFIGSFGGESNNVIYGNLIGMDPSGSTGMGNGFDGIVASGASGTTIGGTSASDRNVIAGNGRAGVGISGGSATVQGNYIGTNEAGNAAIPNGDGAGSGFDYGGVQVSNGASSVTVGGTSSGAGNVISGNTDHGVLITGSGTSVTVEGNHIGTNAARDAMLSNDLSGIEVADGATATIGGATSGAGNVVAGNGEFEIHLATDGNTVQGNYLDTNANGDDLGSSFNAISVDGNGNQIGGTSSSARNVIGHTATNAVRVSGASNTLQGNYIGVMPDGTAIGHPGSNILISGSDNAIGGVGSGEGNMLANSGWGVAIISGSSGNAVRGNAIHSQSQQGIDLEQDGTTANDTDDSDTGSNHLQNYPEIQSASYDSGADEITVTYQVPSDPSLTGSGAPAYDLKVDFYRADTDGSGEVYLGTDTYTTTDYNSGPSKQITFTPAASVTSTDDIVATATDANGNTSEFSAAPATLPVELTAFAARVDGDAVQLAWRTASETNNAGFEVQRKTSGADFQTITFVEGAGTTSRAQRYRFSDTALPPDAERITYRLKQVDLDGAFNYSDEVEVVRGVPEQLTLKPNAPNPVHQQTTIRYALPAAAEVQLAVFDVLGRRVATLVNDQKSAGRHTVTFDAADLPSGVYLYRLQAGDTVQSKRLTIVR